jgi:hypothetical protein
MTKFNENIVGKAVKRDSLLPASLSEELPTYVAASILETML